MRVMAMVMGSEQSEQGVPPDADAFEAMGRFNEQLVKAGVMLAGDGLQPTSAGARLKWSGDGGPTIIDGPFAEAKELVAGFWILEVKSLDEAKALFANCPCGPDAEIQLRPLHELDDFDMPRDVRAIHEGIAKATKG